MPTFVKSSALYLQVANYFEKEIVEGRLSPGSRIPATVKLARQFEVNSDVIQQSLKLLATRGLVERAPGRGTYVRHGVNLKTIGIICDENIYAKSDPLFLSVFLEKITEVFAKNGWNCKLYSTSKSSKYDKTFYELKSAAESGEVRAVIELCSNRMIKKWAEEECPIPYLPMHLTVDFYDLAVNGLTYMLKQGCKKILFLTHILSEMKEVYKTAVDYVKNQYPDNDFEIITVHSYPNTEEGYKAVHDTYSKKCKPDGLFACNDSAFRGALYALLELGIAIPKETKVMTHANKGLDIFCHLPLTKMEVDPEEFAQKMYQELISLIDGKKFINVPIKAKIVPGKTCGE